MKTVFNYFKYILNFDSHNSVIGFQDSATPIMEGIVDLHNYIFFYLILVFVVVTWMFCYIIFNFFIIPTFFYDIFLKNSLFKFLNKKSVFIIEFFFFKFFKYFISKNTFNTFSLFLENLKHKVIIDSYNRHSDYFYTKKIVEHAGVELVWTIIPSIILVLIAIPSFALLYAMDEIIDPKLTVKAIGYQWFRNYEYAETKDDICYNEDTDFIGYNLREYRNYLNYDSVMYTEEELPFGSHRLLTVDHQMILPTNVHIRLMITGGDVIHSWAVPALGIKVDAVPGRMNQIGVFIKRNGVFYGQCSESCGINHGFMPIAVKAVHYDKFIKWYYNKEVYWNV
jgi:cytochrome c oxidase subunit 2